MMIFRQDRKAIEQLGKRIHIVKVGDKYQVVNRFSDNEVTELGEYEKEINAREVLKRISRYIREKYRTYNMPEDNDPSLFWFIVDSLQKY